MKRVLAAGLAMALVVLFVANGEARQKEKKKPRPKPVVAVDEKSAGPDFAVQGEYVGAGVLKDRNQKVGAQVVALGDGKFDVYLLEGGLPGAGWDGKGRHKFSAKREGGKARGKFGTISIEIGNGKLTGFVEDDDRFNLTHVVRKSPTLGLKPPAGAVVLFDGTKESAANWSGGRLVEGNLLNMGVDSKKHFLDFKLHAEFRTPFMPSARGQGRGNSGVYLQGPYEVQVLDSFGLKGENNECGGLYSIRKPDVNMCFPPLSWQTYDIEFKAPRFDKAGKKVANAVITVLHNGVKVHDKVEIPRSTDGGREHPGPGRIHLQNHGNPVYYRNIWVVETKE